MVVQSVRRGVRRAAKVLVSFGASTAVLFAVAGLAVAIPLSSASAAVPNPTVTGPIPDSNSCSATASCPSPPGPADGIHIPIPLDGVSNQSEFTSANYVEEEYYISGTATAYEQDPNAPAWDSTGFWTAIPSTTLPPANYVTRILVRRPADPKKFNGIVVVEWLNVTAGTDLAPDYGYYRTELLRDGFVWVGVTAQYVGVYGGGFFAPPGFGLISYDPVRYGSLVHPGDSYAYDIFSQAAQAIRNPVGVNPLGSSAYVIKGMIADGESQSAAYMVTYYDAIQPLDHLFDGFLIHSRGAGGAALFAGSGGAVPTPAFLRTDQVPALVLETETDTVGHYSARQPDSDTYRLWEPAGTAHVDSYDLASLNANQATQEPFYPANSCTYPDNSAHERYIMNAALFRLSQWIDGGTPAPSAPPIDVVSGVIQRDSLGIAEGGIRLPEMDVPTLTQQGVGNTGTPFCILFGRALPLPVSLPSLYGNHGTYVSDFTHATNALQAEGFLLGPDAQNAKTTAAQSSVPQ
jgi:Alpha/beta hydrolase domain